MDRADQEIAKISEFRSHRAELPSVSLWLRGAG